MASDLRAFLIGADRSGSRRRLESGSRGHLEPLLAIGLFATTFVAYALGIFQVSGGVVWVPADAALVGMIAACWAGFYRKGLAVAWAVAYASLLGYRADHAFLGQSRRSLTEQLAYFVRPDGLAFLAVEGVVFGTLAFVGGYLARWGYDSTRRGAAPASAEP